ncbi:DEAD/DEAH box helicase family protein [Mucilaginibacter sp. HD30]
MTNTSDIFDITNVTFDQVITYSKDVTYFKEIPEVTPIPTNSIVYKTVTGIGATHSEIVAERHSIIVLPHISIITSKHDYYKNEKGVKTLAIYGEVKVNVVREFLHNDDVHTKILTTPKGLNKIIAVMREHEQHLDYKKLFFLLIDECHKLVQDAFYRTDMVELMEHFFDFERKAMVSATPIPPSDPRFKKKGKEFKHIKVCPEYDYKQPINVVPTDSVVNTVGEYFNENKAECFCIFFNSVEGIKSLINQTSIKDDYVIFCSKESKELLKLSDEPNVSNSIGGFKRYNFFTSSFFNGLDIYMDIKPDVIIITDYGYKDHTLLDPYTDILQIMGRFRRTDAQRDNNEYAYRKVTHINNAGSFTNPLTKPEAILKIEHSKIVYEHILTLQLSLYDNKFKQFIDHQLKTVKPYFRLLSAKGDFSHFLQDNYLDDERVKVYYKSTSVLLNAYTHTKLYDVNQVPRKTYDKDTLMKLQRKSIRYSSEMNKRMANDLLELDDYKGLDVYYEQRANVEKLSPVIFDAYKRLGYQKLIDLEFKKTPIEKELLKLDIENGLNHLPLINMVYMTFRLNVKYTVEEVKEKLLEIFEEFNISYRAKSTDVFRYFEYKETKAKGGDNKDDRAYVFTAQKFNPISGRLHI